VLGYFGGACSVVAMAVADKSPSKKGQPLTVEGVDDRAFREPTLPHPNVDTLCTHPTSPTPYVHEQINTCRYTCRYT
jgi:hypothetical protein